MPLRRRVLRAGLWAAHVFAALALLALLLPAGSARAGTAVELSAKCAFTCDGQAVRTQSRLTDGSYLHAFEEARGRLEIAAPEGERIGWVYLCFAQTPADWRVERPGEDGWEPFAAPEEGFAHALVATPGLSKLRIVARDEALALNEVRVFTEGTLPGDVQAWQSAPRKADLLVLAAHPDDEFIFFGGLIPLYVSRGKQVVVACAAVRNGTRRSEFLNGLWEAGVRTYPVFGAFQDRYFRTLEAAYDLWTREELDYFVMRLYREYQPEVVVTHDAGGEYGHGGHRACADSALRMFDKAADVLYLPQLSRRLGVWQPKKLYLHLWRENALRLDYSADVGGRSALDAAQSAFSMHVSQQHFHVQCGPDDPYDCALFGLAKTAVGPDAPGGDLFENLAE